ncbi:hypothetical protein [Nocardioides bizhenqiangii]|uniref:Multidrug transporter n=1 Tax=Nocardioides bizhenqiangii TaxID=3095076 RepID=A0ABZ0ZP08_9ACTN|nr:MULTISPECIES: hypothetical protein [unclassified Nocardioides]MDZ5619948.1 hypothetical protein [Nocardioides sp. HM23]WQQ26049.1 hypothetical protein SHK19_19045 [Nocardioides sp. HM61]
MLSIPLLRWLWGAAAVLVVGHLLTLYLEHEHGVSRAHSVPRQFDLNGEGNLAAWFQSSLLLTCALLTLALASHYRGQGAPLAHRWVALSGLFGLMAIDETAQLHDMFTGPLRRGLEIDFGIFYFAWLLPAVGFLAICAWYFAPVAFSLPAAIYRRLFLAFAVYFGGAVLVEMISGFAAENGRQSTPYHLVLTVEESCEIAGILLVVTALLTMVRMVQPQTTVSLLDGGTVRIAPAASVSSEARAERLP